MTWKRNLNKIERTNMILYEDSNQKQGHHTLKNKYWQSKGIEIDRTHRLIVGDYMLSLDAKISVDSKQNLLELATNMFCDKARFEKECIRAKNSDIKLIFLIEEKFDKQKLLKWQAPKQIDGKRFLNVYGWKVYKEIKRNSKIFNVDFRFVIKLSKGKMIWKRFARSSNIWKCI